MRNIKPILFSTPMVQAILEGRKMQTRRVKGLESKNEDPNNWNRHGNPGRSINRIWDSTKEKNPNPLEIEFGFRQNFHSDGDISYMRCAVKPGDVFWVRETWQRHYHLVQASVDHVETSEDFVFKADNPPTSLMLEEKWKPSIFMPKVACRIFLEVIDVRVERLQDISYRDIRKEGIQIEYPLELGKKNPPPSFFKDCKRNDVVGSRYISSYIHWASLWSNINGRESWDANPWVWVYDFKRVEKPENF